MGNTKLMAQFIHDDHKRIIKYIKAKYEKKA